MTNLLDINLLIALLDRDHVHNNPARQWFDSLRDPWATCPITEMGVVRIMSGPRYPKGLATPEEALLELKKLQKIGHHEFWTDDLRVGDLSIFTAGRMNRSSQVTDSYLLALAASRGGKLVTFDAKLDPATVQGGAAALVLLPD